MSTEPFDRVAIIGLGLIGSSLARGLREKKLARHITGFTQSSKSLSYCLDEHIIDEGAKDAATAVQNADLVILATPPGTFSAITQSIGPSLKAGGILIDVGSVKQQAIAAIVPHLPKHVDFIPAHPIAGSEKTGPEAGTANLFKGRKVILTPQIPEATPALTSIKNLWLGLGAEVEMMPAETHDLVYAYVSHLPQLVAFAAQPVLADANIKESNEFFDKFIRLGGSDPLMWRDIFIANHHAILAAVDTYIAMLAHMVQELSSNPDQPSEDNPLVPTRLFPRIAASCLVATVNTLERNSGIKAARYAGAGFADVACPAMNPPEKDIEYISKSHKQIAAMVAGLLKELEKLRTLIAEGKSDALLHALETAKTAHAKIL